MIRAAPAVLAARDDHPTPAPAAAHENTREPPEAPDRTDSWGKPGQLETEDGLSRRGMRLTTIGFAVVAVVASAVVLWNRQSEDALLGVGSIGGALATVLFWGLPGLVLYVTLARSYLVAVGEGAVLVALLVTQWWISATDSHSTAFLGPGIMGWVLIPGIVVAGTVTPVAWHHWRTGSQETRRFLAIVFVASVLGTLVFGPFAWLLGVVVGGRGLRRRRADDGGIATATDA